MKRMTKILTAALMTSTFAAAPAVAGSSSADAGVSIGAETSGGNATLGLNAAADTTSRAGTSAAQDEVILAIRANADAASKISTMTDASAVTVVNVGSTADVSAEEIDQAVSQNEATISDLRTSLQANAGVYNKLEAEGVNLSSVVAAKTAADGSLTVYVR
ncbi:MAG: hypothetical protein ACSHXI_14340 [Hoeflea sp.]|uniref:hypothetical protein n=1 Tax=Hoeflea sp. TaxID=1940281 RepID=UPI003EF20D2D